MKVLMISDPPSELQPRFDTSISFLAEAFKRKCESFWTWSDQVYWKDHSSFTQAHSVKKVVVGELPDFGEQNEYSLDDFDVIFIRKNPPFDDSYLRLCWLVALHENKVRVVNRASTLSRYHEKIVQLEALREGFLSSEHLIPTLITENYETAMDYVNKSNVAAIVCKPWLGYGGRGIYKFSKEDFEVEGPALFQKHQAWMVQPFIPEISEWGDRRVLFVHGKYVGDFVRLPAKGDFVSNLSQGGRAEKRSLNAKEEESIHLLEKFLLKHKIDFAGADLIGSYVNEVNITSPTGVVNLKELNGIDCVTPLMDKILK